MVRFGTYPFDPTLKEHHVATEIVRPEYTDRSMDAAGALDYFARKMAFTTGPVELDRAIRNGEVNVVDVRLEKDYETGHIPGSINLPQERWTTLEGLVKDKPNVLVCYSNVCHLAAHAALQFSNEGYPVMELDGGWKEWQRHNLAVEKS